MRVVVLAPLVLLAAIASAQSSSQPAAGSKSKREPPPGTLHSLAVKGNQMYSAADIARESGLKPGERITPAIIDQARKKLQDTELFNDVSYDYHFSAGTVPGYDVTFEVAENQQVFPMRFERIGLTPEAARACLKTHVDLYSDRIPAAEGVLKRYTAAVQDCVNATNS